jgi:hypothetical protein
VKASVDLYSAGTTSSVLIFLLTREDGLDAVEDESERQQRSQLGHGLRHVLALGEDVADVVAAEEDDHRDEHRQDEGQHRHHHDGERRRLGVAGAKLIAHPDTESTKLIFFLGPQLR